MAANWKMNKTIPEALAFVDEIRPKLRQDEEAELVICPPFTALCSVGMAIKDTCLKLAAQDVFGRKGVARVRFHRHAH